MLCLNLSDSYDVMNFNLGLNPAHPDTLTSSLKYACHLISMCLMCHYIQMFPQNLDDRGSYTGP